MLRRTVLVTWLLLAGALPVSAGENPDAKLALHVVASEEYLYCPDLAPVTCDSINVEVSVQELLDKSGYGYIAIIAYDIDSLTGVEFALDGWPSGRGAPVLSGPTWCEDALSLGDHEDGGGITAFQACVESDSTSGIAILAYWSFGPLDSTDLPIDLSIIPSTFSDEDSLLVVLDCTVDFEQDEVVAVSGCTVGGIYSGTAPDCSGEEDGGEGAAGPAPLAADFIGPWVQEAGTRVFLPLAGIGLGADTRVFLRDGIRVREAAFERQVDRVFQFEAQTESNDLGLWDIVIHHGTQRIVLPEALKLVANPNRAAFDEFCARGGECIPGLVGIKIRPSAFSYPADQEFACPFEITGVSEEVSDILREFRISRIEKTFPPARPPDDPRTEVLAKFYRLRFHASIDVGDVLAALNNVSDITSSCGTSQEPPVPVILSTRMTLSIVSRLIPPNGTCISGQINTVRAPTSTCPRPGTCLA